MPKSLADGNIQLWALTARPADPTKLKVADLTGAVPIMCRINKADYQLRVSGNASIAEQEACKKGEGTGVGPEQYEGNLTPFWYFDDAGLPDAEGMTVWELLKEPGTELFLVEMEGPESKTPAAGMPYDYFEAGTGSPKAPDNRFEGYSKRSIQLFVSDHASGVLATA